MAGQSSWIRITSYNVCYTKLLRTSSTYAAAAAAALFARAVFAAALFATALTIGAPADLKNGFRLLAQLVWRVNVLLIAHLK